MILVDRRVGSADLAPLLRRYQIEVEVVELEFADVAFTGRGPSNTDIVIGIEIKTIGDLVSSMESGRLSGHQLPGLVKDYDAVELIVEGEWRPGPTGLLEVAKIFPGREHGVEIRKWVGLASGRDVTYSAVEGYLNTLSYRAGVDRWRTMSRQETAAVIAVRYNWWTSKPYEAHRSHLATPPEAMIDHGLLRPVSDEWRQCFAIAAVLPGLGRARAEALANKFRCPAGLFRATEAEIAGVEMAVNGGADGRKMRVGAAAAKKAWQSLHSVSVSSLKGEVR